MCIYANQINKSYGDFKVLHDVSFSCETGEILVMLGPSGAGKSSLLRMLNLLELGQSGKLSIAEHDFDFSNHITEKKGLELRRKVGMVFQQYHLWPHMTVMENLLEAPKFVAKESKQQAKPRAMALLEKLQLADKADSWPLALSGGQQQRVAIARALMMQPDVLLFDEPTAALDPKVTHEVAKLILDFAETGITQVVVTHDVDFAKKIATHILYMEHGKIVEQGCRKAFENPQTQEFKHYLSH